MLSDLSIYVVSLSEGPSEEARVILSQLKENRVPVVVVFTKSDLVSEDRKNTIRLQLLHLADELRVPIGGVFSSLSLPVDTFTISCVGVKAGSVFGARYKSKAEFVGGTILILIGVKILLEHLGGL